MNRYTSAELSRQLAEAGVEQDHRNTGQMRLPWWVPDPRFGFPPHLSIEQDTVYLPDGSFRALDLQDCIEEIEKLEPTAEWSCHTCDLGYAFQAWLPSRGIQDDAADDLKVLPDCLSDSPVEAAGHVLLALKERAK